MSHDRRIIGIGNQISPSASGRVEDDLLQVACYSPLRIPEGSRRDIAEALVRDFEDSELRFQVAQITDGVAVGEAVIDRMIGTALWCMGTKRPGRPLGGWKGGGADMTGVTSDV